MDMLRWRRKALHRQFAVPHEAPDRTLHVLRQPRAQLPAFYLLKTLTHPVLRIDDVAKTWFLAQPSNKSLIAVPTPPVDLPKSVVFHETPLLDAPQFGPVQDGRLHTLDESGLLS